MQREQMLMQSVVATKERKLADEKRQLEDRLGSPRDLLTIPRVQVSTPKIGRDVEVVRPLVNVEGIKYYIISYLYHMS